MSIIFAFDRESFRECVCWWKELEMCDATHLKYLHMYMRRLLLTFDSNFFIGRFAYIVWAKGISYLIYSSIYIHIYNLDVNISLSLRSKIFIAVQSHSICGWMEVIINVLNKNNQKNIIRLFDYVVYCVYIYKYEAMTCLLIKWLIRVMTKTKS